MAEKLYDALRIFVVRGKDVMDHEWDDPQLLPWPERFAILRLASIPFKKLDRWDILMYVNVCASFCHLIMLYSYTFMFSPFFIMQKSTSHFLLSETTILNAEY